MVNIKEINDYLLLCELSREIGLISLEVYQERLTRLIELSEGNFNKSKYLSGRTIQSPHNSIEPSKINENDRIKHGDEIQNGNPNRFSLITKRKGKYGKWILAGISDPHPEPSIPHFHGLENNNLKLDPYNGKVYENGVFKGKEDMDIIRGMWQHQGFRDDAWSALKAFRNENNETVFKRYLNKRNLIEEEFEHLPKRKSRKIQRVF
ncbi:hypothetical protein P5G62_010085 [Neobacillus sp. 179-C4.2 HS]|uniref:HNH endonuclease n=1 Tax=Neobacillus driksii TaxID=3035913 RepID=A0ABV4YRK4_9BACI|nr:hypothetical protein [Neobacillus sp. 179.-C4.2 HS]